MGVDMDIGMGVGIGIDMDIDVGYRVYDRGIRVVIYPFKTME